MDILISSNLERLLFLAAGAEKTRNYMASLAKDGKYTLDAEDYNKIASEFVGYFTSEDECRDEIKSVFGTYSYLIDTHTAVALSAADRYADENANASGKIVVASTASPYKFASSVAGALELEICDDDAKIFETLSSHTNTKVPSQLSDVLTKEIRFKTVINPEDMKASVIDFIS
jgi:threonine synthase